MSYIIVDKITNKNIYKYVLNLCFSQIHFLIIISGKQNFVMLIINDHRIKNHDVLNDVL